MAKIRSLTVPRIVLAMSLSVRNAGSSKHFSTSRSNAMLIRSAGSFLRPAASSIASAAILRAAGGS
ncbi:MAG TPA: hypothetical protein VIY28_10955 [Pseudonocardiaceae bacterium]